MRTFLLQTAILDTLCGPLCDAVTRQTHGKETLEGLERGNVFVVPLDDERRWYRYHRLFADVLRVQLLDEAPDLMPTLHRRASEWYAENGARPDAIRHALRSGDLEWAADLIELAGPLVEDSSQSATWFTWALALPEELVRARPVLSVRLAYALLGRGDIEAADSWLADAERWLEPGRAPSMVVVDHDELRSLLAAIAVARAYRAQSLGDVAGTVGHAQRVFELLPDGDHLRRQQATALLGMTYWASGDLAATDRVFAEYSLELLAAGNVADAISAATVLTEVRPVLGRLRGATDTLNRLLEAVLDKGEPLPPDTADLYRGWVSWRSNEVTSRVREHSCAGARRSVSRVVCRSGDGAGASPRLGST